MNLIKWSSGTWQNFFKSRSFGVLWGCGNTMHIWFFQIHPAMFRETSENLSGVSTSSWVMGCTYLESNFLFYMTVVAHKTIEELMVLTSIFSIVCGLYLLFVRTYCGAPRCQVQCRAAFSFMLEDTDDRSSISEDVPKASDEDEMVYLPFLRKLMNAHLPSIKWQRQIPANIWTCNRHSWRTLHIKDSVDKNILKTSFSEAAVWTT